MVNISENFDKLLADLQRERDELKVKLHLGKQDVKDEWQKLEDKLNHLEAKAKSLGKTTAAASKDVGAAAKLLAEEIKNGFDKVRKQL